MTCPQSLEWQTRENDPWLRVGEPTQSSSFQGDLDGKYLFFSENQQLLMLLVESEIIRHGFQVAKVVKNPRGKEYVACLYWHNPLRREELRKRWGNHPDIKYRYYKTNADTRAGKYSEQFLSL